MKAASVNIITIELAEKLREKGVDTIIYLGLGPGVDAAALSRNVKLVYAMDDLPSINDFAFDLVADRLQYIRKKIPGIFNYQGYDLVHALEKDIFWGLFENNAVNYQVDKYKKAGYSIVNCYTRKATVRWLALAKKLFAGKNNLYQVDLPGQDTGISKDTIVFRVNELELLEIYGNLPKRLPGENVISFQNILRKNADEIHEQFSKIFKLNIPCLLRPVSKNKLRTAYRLKLLGLRMDGDFLNVMTDALFKLFNHVEQYERLARAGVRKIFVAAGENEGEANVLCEVMARHHGTTFNYMNGAKGREKNNIHTNFTYWFMPNDSTKKLMLSYCQVTDQQLPVTGHLLEEQVYNYQYSGTLDALKDQLSGKKIIALFTSFIFIKEQTDVMDLLAAYLDEHPDTVVLIRRHPSDRRKDMKQHARIIVLPPLEVDMYNKTLFDLFSRSNLTISFSSTVSMQSTWFNLPTLNFEYSAASVLPYVDNIKVLHVNSLAQLKTLLDTYLAQGTEKQQANELVPVSEIIMNLIKSA